MGDEEGGDESGGSYGFEEHDAKDGDDWSENDSYDSWIDEEEPSTEEFEEDKRSAVDDINYDSAIVSIKKENRKSSQNQTKNYTKHQNRTIN